MDVGDLSDVVKTDSDRMTFCYEQTFAVACCLISSVSSDESDTVVGIVCVNSILLQLN